MTAPFGARTLNDLQATQNSILITMGAEPAQHVTREFLQQSIKKGGGDVGLYAEAKGAVIY